MYGDMECAVILKYLGTYQKIYKRDKNCSLSMQWLRIQLVSGIYLVYFSTVPILLSCRLFITFLLPCSFSEGCDTVLAPL